ncbi:Flagellar Member 3 [Trypanosoma brucei equiperdum]|uniref:Flagellar Member 3 n=1 Tax=Trypanosoma brucei equiperdum TaxID=630700 RepID=A0A3L6L2E7_9TRYP|nr:Flagellar Member 3 [Trypanosoma brucei equiperdum]
MRRRNQNEQRRNPSVDSNARDRKPGVMFPTTPENQGVPIEDVRSSYSRLTSTSSQRTAQRHVSMLEASRHRLSIRKIAAFPMQQTAPKPFLASCADITRYARNWNAEFQFAWEAEDNTISQAVSRMEALRRIEKEFVEEATRKAKQIVTLDDNGPRELPKFLQCYRVDNIFFRVLPDSRSGRNYVASLRGVLQSRSRLLTVPLSCMIFYRGMPVLAQALVPMSANPTRLYGAESTDDSEVEAEILHMADALNIPFPDGTLEVYEGLDGRLYLTNSNSTLTPLFVDDTIMKRQEMLRLCGNVTDGHMDTVSLLDNTEVLDRIVHACVDSESRSNGERLRKLCDVLHSIGINMCLLKQVVCKTEGVGRYSPDVTQRVRELISIEMIARSVKQEFYLEVQGKRVAYDDDILAGTVSKHIGAAFTNLDNFRSIFLEVVAKKYGIIDSDEDLIKSLTDIRMGRKADIVARICALIGVSIEKTSKNHTVMRWHAHVNASVLPKLIDPQYVRALSEKYRTIVTQDGYRYAFCLPVRWKVACWDGHYDEALALVRETAKAHMELCAPVSLSPLYSRRSVCEVCFATMEKDYIAEGRGLFPDTMRGFEELTGPVTQGRLHIEYGFWLLRVATLYQSDELATYRSCVEEAAKHFYSAIEKLPGYLKSEHGAWLHLQPYKGLLQCKQLLPSCSVNTKELVSHSVELSTIGWASDYFMYYLWDLSLQLESEGWYEDAIRVLLTAITISKKKPTESRDLPSLLTDGAHIYRSWDREKYVEHCMTLLREAGDKAADLFGVQSREYAVVQNNKGAIEIDLNRLSDAGESLKRAGLAFDKAGVPKDDPDFLAYLENLRYLEQHLSSRPVVYRGILQRYPFLATRVDSFPFVDVRLLEDEVFVELAHQRARASKDTTESRQLEQAMKERMWELHRSIQEGDILKRYPFLRAEVHGVRTASLRLEDDGFFMDLVHKLRSSDDSKQTNALEYAICEYVAKKAKDTALERAFVDRQEQEFSDTHGGYVNLMLPIPWIYVLEDEQVRTLIDQIRKCTMSQSLGPGLVQIQGQLASRVDEIELDAFRWRKELSPWLSSSKRYSVSATDLAGDTHLHDLLRVHRLCVSRGDAEAEWIHALISAKLEAMWERASIVRTCLAVDDEELHQQFPFLEERPYHQRLSMLRLHEDSAAATLMDQLAKKNTDSKLQSELAVAVHHLAARRHDDNELQRLNYDVESFTTENFVVETVPNMRDDYYVVLSQRRNAEFMNNADDSPTALGLTHQMEERVLQMNVWVRKVNANRFRRRQRSEAKYPFVSRRHLGFTLDALDVEGDNEFMALVIAREKLTTMKPVVVAEVDKLNARANDRVAWLAVRRTTQIKEHNQKYPFIPSRMEGIDTSTMHLEENQKFAQKAEQYSKLPNSLGTSNDLRRKRLVREMLNHALAIARESNVRQWREAIESEDLRERYPFLPEEPVRGVCLADVRPAQQQEFRDLSNELDELRRDPAGNAEAIAAMEEKMKALVTQLAEENATQTDAVHKQYPFLPKRVMGIPLGELPIKDDEVFAASEKETTTKKETVLQSRVVQLASGAHLSEVLLADADDAVLSGNPFLIYTTRKCFPLRHIRLSEDNLFNQLLAEYKSLLQRFKLDEDSVASVRFRLACRADEIALEEIKKIEKIMEMFHELKPLSLEDIRLLESQGVLAMTGDGSLDAVHPDLLNSVRDILENERKGRAAKVREVDELRKTYPMLGRNIDPNMLHNPLVAKLVGDHDELMDDIDKNAEKLQRLEAELARTTQEIMTSTPSDVSDDEIKNTHDTGLSQDEINTYIEEEIMNDKYYQELHREYQRIKEEGTPAGIKLQRILQTRMAMRKSQLHKAFRSEIEAEERKVGRLMKIFQNIQKTVKGIKIASLNIYEDNEIQQLLKEEQRTVRDNEKKQQIEVNKTKRVRAIVEERKAEEESLAAAYPFLGRTLKGIPLGELHLMSDPTFAELASHYTQDASNMDPAARAQQEKLLRDAADKIVSDLRSSRLRAAVRAEGLRERYPFLPEEPVRGVCLADVRPAQQQEFRDLSNELDELRRDPAGDAEAIAAMEEKMKALVTQLAEENATKTDAVHKQYPFLPKRVMGIPLGELSINDDAMFSQLGQRWLQQKSSSDGGKDAVATEEEMLQRVKDLARLARLAEKESEDANEYVRACNPFLLYEDRKCVLLSDIPLSKDDGYQKLFNEHLSALEDAEANAERLTELEEALRARADELALNESVRRALLNKCPFLASQDGLELSEKLLHDPVFQQQCARYDELMRDPVKNADALRQLEREMSLSMKSAAGGDPTASGSVGGAGALDGTSAAKGARTSSDGESFAGGLPGARGALLLLCTLFFRRRFWVCRRLSCTLRMTRTSRSCWRGTTNLFPMVESPNHPSRSKYMSNSADEQAKLQETF